METSETIGEIAAAMAKAQGEMRAAVKGSDNPFFKSKYADLHSCFEAIREAYSKHGIAVIQSASVDSQWFVNVTTMLAHSQRVGKGDRAPAHRSNLRQGPGHHRVTQTIGLRRIMSDPAGGIIKQSVQWGRVLDMQGDVIASRRQSLQFCAFMLSRKIPIHKRKTLKFSTLPS